MTSWENGGGILLNGFKPRGTADILALPIDQIPEIVRDLIREREMTPLINNIHADMRSMDPDVRRRGKQALERMGFPE